MNQTRRNPIGHRVDESVVVVRVGQGLHTHIYNPNTQAVLCNSGKNAGNVTQDGEDNRGKQQTLYRSNSRFVTCYRCQKLAHVNEQESRPLWQGPR